MVSERTPVLEIGGTHLTAALVSHSDWSVVTGSVTRIDLHAHGTADELIADFLRGANSLGSDHNSEWSVAMPGPFDYENGIGQFENVGKFDSLKGVDLREALTRGIHPTPSFVHFINDADSYGVGEYAVGAAHGLDRVICITLGTGVGSAFLVEGEPVAEGKGVAPEGEAHFLDFDGRPLEETVSRRAIRAAYAERAQLPAGTPVDDTPDVREIADLARAGDPVAGGVMGYAFRSLGQALADCVFDFRAQVLAIGGSMSQSWDLVEPAIREGLALVHPELSTLQISAAERRDDAPVVGAAFWAVRHHR